MFRIIVHAVVSGHLQVHCLARKTFTITMPYYAVARGRAPGVFHSWDECESQVKGFSGARYKKFNTETEARDFIQANAGADSRSGQSYQGSAVGGGHNYDAGNGGNYKNVRSYHTTGSVVTVPHSRTLSTSTTSNSSNKSRKTCTGSTYNKDESFNIDGIEDPEEINNAVSKHLDNLESRLEGVKRNVERIYSGAQPGCGGNKRTLLTDALPQPNKKRREDGSFETDGSGFVQVYTDGACSSNGQSGARAGYGVWWGDDHPLNKSGPVSGRATNNCGEIQAATEACRQARQNGISRLCINTDSKFLIDSATKWMPAWKKNGYRTASGAPVKNTEDFQQLDCATEGLEVQWRYVEAHRGVHGNEQADRLAREGASQYRY